MNTLISLKPELADRFAVQTLGVFGFVTRNDFRSEDSDVDIIVEFSRPVGIEFIDLANYLERKINRKIDLVSKKGIKKPYFQAIEREIVYV